MAPAATPSDEIIVPVAKVGERIEVKEEKHTQGEARCSCYMPCAH
jgi:hypothetical protein